MSTLLGQVGNLLTLPAVSVEQQTPEIAGSTSTAIGGRRKRWRTGTPRRTFQLSRDHATLDEWSVVEQLAWGGYGSGPFVLLLPGRRNLLGANVSSGTNVLASTLGFGAVSGTVSSSTAQQYLAPRSLAWAVTAANQRVVASLTANITSADPATDVPVVAGLPYTGSLYARLSASTGTVRPDISWFTAAGAFLSTTTGTATALSSSAWTRVAVTNAVAPATAALAKLSLTNTVMGAAQTIYSDAWQLEQATAASAFLFGTGVPRVAFDSLDDGGGKVWERSGSFTLVEVG